MKASVYAAIVTVIIIVAAAGVYWWTTSSYGEKNTKIVKEGEEISVRYYGYIYYGGERRVFDTNIRSVAEDNQTYPKTLTFQWPNSFHPLNFTVGDGTMIKGFDLGVRGMKEGETKTIIVPPDLGYVFSWKQVKNYSLEEEVPQVENLTLEEFQKRTGEQNPGDNTVYRDKRYGWSVLVLAVNPSEDRVTILNNPSEGESYTPYKNVSDFKVYVESIKNGIIHLRYVIEKLPILLPDGGIIDKVWDGHFRINYNKEVAGKTLYFVVTVISIKSSE
ncbi:MAG: FKBP-type peptidyl-prolyl cis-trans isomerase [Thermoplasmata archaeon]|nr:FKBP-type peptidyl-prolyl cis-trans isomerase [Thermoplasmata archaeon]